MLYCSADRTTKLRPIFEIIAPHLQVRGELEHTKDEEPAKVEKIKAPRKEVTTSLQLECNTSRTLMLCLPAQDLVTCLICT